MHGPAAEYEARPDEQRKAELVRYLESLSISCCRAAIGLTEFELIDQIVEALAVFGAVDAVGGGADDFYAGLFEGDRQFQRCLPAELYDDTVRILLLHNRHDIFER